MRPHQKLEAWAKGIELVIAIYKNSEHFPKEERYGLTARFGVQQFRYRQISPKVFAQRVAPLPAWLMLFTVVQQRSSRGAILLAPWLQPGDTKKCSNVFNRFNGFLA